VVAMVEIVGVVSNLLRVCCCDVEDLLLDFFHSCRRGAVTLGRGVGQLISGPFRRRSPTPLMIPDWEESSACIGGVLILKSESRTSSILLKLVSVSTYACLPPFQQENDELDEVGRYKRSSALLGGSVQAAMVDPFLQPVVNHWWISW